MRAVGRDQWGSQGVSCSARTDWPAQQGLVVHHSASVQHKDHADCPAAVRAIERTHLGHPAENYCAIAYNWLVCAHGVIFEGRGWEYRSGANGSGSSNQKYVSACVLGNSPQPELPIATALRAIRKELLARQAMASRVIPHSAIKATACPGDPLRKWIRDRKYEVEEKVAFTPEEEKILKDIVAAVKRKDSNGGFAAVLIDHVRDHPKYSVDVTVREAD